MGSYIYDGVNSEALISDEYKGDVITVSNDVTLGITHRFSYDMALEEDEFDLIIGALGKPVLWYEKLSDWWYGVLPSVTVLGLNIYGKSKKRRNQIIRLEN